jgi:hypothetical protein
MKRILLLSIQLLTILFVSAQSISDDPITLRDRYIKIFTKDRLLSFDGLGDNHFPEFKRECSNINAAITIGANLVWPTGNLGYNLSGSGMNYLGIWDSGAIRGTHQEFRNRVTQMDGTTSLSPHSNGVAGIMMATGILPSAKGMSYLSSLKASGL